MIEVNPNVILKKVRPKGGFRKLITQGLTVNKAALRAVSRLGFIQESSITETTLKVIRTYKKNERKLTKEGLSKSSALRQSFNSGKLIESRIENSVVYEMSKAIEERYSGLWFEWMPSDAETPDPEHQLKYGKKFKIGRDEIPGERFGCRCGMRILTPEETLEL